MDRPTIVCLCGSTRYKEVFESVNLQETLAGRIVLSVGGFGHADNLNLTEETKQMLDELHKRKIDLADEVYILNYDGYIGDSTLGELIYALQRGKRIRFYSLEILSTEEREVFWKKKEEEIEKYREVKFPREDYGTGKVGPGLARCRTAEGDLDSTRPTRGQQCGLPSGHKGAHEFYIDLGKVYHDPSPR